MVCDRAVLVSILVFYFEVGNILLKVLFGACGVWKASRSFLNSMSSGKKFVCTLVLWHAHHFFF